MILEDFVRSVLPWIGGFTGATLLYFIAMVFLNYRHDRRLRRVEEEIALVRGLLLALHARQGRLRRGGSR